MIPLAELQSRWAQPGRIVWIGLRPERRAPLVSVESAEIALNGLAGDHARPGKRAVTLFQHEHRAAYAGYLGRDDVAPGDLRRNIHVAGLNLSALRGRAVRLGDAVLRLTVPCAPCSRMEEAFGPGGYAALRGHGGWCAEVIRVGQVAIGDACTVLDPTQIE